MKKPFAIAAMLLCLSAVPLHAENQPAPPAPNRSAPFDPNLERLAEILGALALSAAHVRRP